MMAEDEEVGGGGASDKPKYSVEEFLGLFDGSVDSGKPNGRLVFFTTNTPDALHHKVAALSNDLYEFCNPGKQVMKDYWQNFFQDQQKIIVEKTWNAFSANYKSVWKLGKKEVIYLPLLLLQLYGRSCQRQILLKWRHYPMLMRPKIQLPSRLLHLHFQGHR